MDRYPDLAVFLNLPRFSDGRINYSNSSSAPVLNCVVKWKDNVLILKRSDKVSNYKGYWNFVAGFIDKPKSVESKALEEVCEEIGVYEKDVLQIKSCEPYEVFDSAIKKTWIVYPVLVDLKFKPEIKLDWEHNGYAWIRPEELNKYQTIIKLDETLKRVLS